MRKQSEFKHFGATLTKVIYNNYCNTFMQIIIIIIIIIIMNLFHFGFEIGSKIMEI